MKNKNLNTIRITCKTCGSPKEEISFEKIESVDAKMAFKLIYDGTQKFYHCHKCDETSISMNFKAL